MKIDAYKLWERVDKLRNDTPLTDICKETGIKYTRIRDNRSANRLPSLEDTFAIAEYLNCSIDFLVRGEDKNMSAEMIFINNNEAARLLVRKMMDNPPLVEALAAVAALADKDNIKTKQA